MARIIPIVEGHGEVKAVPILILRIVNHLKLCEYVDVRRPIRVQRNKIAKSQILEKYIHLAAQIAGILVLLDADQDCPMSLAATLLERARRTRSDRTIKVVLAKTEFESWFLAAAPSIQCDSSPASALWTARCAGRRGIRLGCMSPPDPEAIRDAKRWLTDQMPSGYRCSPTADQLSCTRQPLSSAHSVSRHRRGSLGTVVRKILPRSGSARKVSRTCRRAPGARSLPGAAAPAGRRPAGGPARPPRRPPTAPRRSPGTGRASGRHGPASPCGAGCAPCGPAARRTACRCARADADHAHNPNARTSLVAWRWRPTGLAVPTASESAGQEGRVPISHMKC